jgi:uncharacterized protein YxjI
VRDTAGDVVIQVEGGNINLGGLVIDKLGFKDAAGAKFCSVERRILATTTCYDIYVDGECVAKVSGARGGRLRLLGGGGVGEPSAADDRAKP